MFMLPDMPTAPADALDPEVNYEQVSIEIDETPIALARNTKAEVRQTADGPYRMFARNTSTTLYRADGSPAVVPISGLMRYLRKVDPDSGQRVFYQKPPKTLPKNNRVCVYCGKKFRPSTDLEITASLNNSKLNDPEAQAILKEMGYDGDTNPVHDVDYKLASHIQARHGKLAAFTGDPLITRLREAAAAAA